MKNVLTPPVPDNSWLPRLGNHFCPLVCLLRARAVPSWKLMMNLYYYCIADILTAQHKPAYHLIPPNGIKIHHRNIQWTISDLLPGHIELESLKSKMIKRNLNNAKVIQFFNFKRSLKQSYSMNIRKWISNIAVHSFYSLVQTFFTIEFLNTIV